MYLNKQSGVLVLCCMMRASQHFSKNRIHGNLASHAEEYTLHISSGIVVHSYSYLLEIISMFHFTLSDNLSIGNSLSMILISQRGRDWS